jgi:hypothetical protein
VTQISLSVKEVLFDVEPELLKQFCLKLGIQHPKLIHGQITSDSLETTYR